MDNRQVPLIVLAAGGTGGHVYPAESLATEMLTRGFRLALITDRRGYAYGGVLGNLDTYRVPAGGVAGKIAVSRIKSISEIMVGIWQARKILIQLNPQVVVGFGGYASIPSIAAASFGSYKTAIHEQNAIFGRANRLLAPRVDKIITCFDEIEQLPASSLRKVVQSGMPVRAKIIAQRETPYPELSAELPIRLLVLGGSQGARILSDVVPQAIINLPDQLKARISITQQCRPEDIDRVHKKYSDAKIKADLSSFFDDIPEQMVKAHLVISRSGASTVAEALVVGCPTIMVPYMYAIDDHQTKNAHAVDAAGAGWLIAEKSFTPETLSARLDNLLSIPNTLNNAAARAKASGSPDATKRLADIIEDLMVLGVSNENTTNCGRSSV
jgi:UDP-N-acetylglucosamine--N-acetylmuramyl-(pentapeptide) pyrophosphoryl-undecaprenol N-acetylglucosamine transferase